MVVQEAKSAFGNGDVYIEKYVQNPRHVEIQILSDKKGNVVHLGERDCSIQRRHQKLVEESPSPFITDNTRKKMCEAAVMAAKSIRYQGAGTVEFLVDKNQDFYFMEMNTRIQVEHPVTEMVTSIDLIKEQIKISSTNKLSLKQSDIKFNGHSIELRINAEDFSRNFAPSPGTINLYLPPGGFGVRVDSHVYPGYSVPPNYDSMVAKLIIWGKDRDEALKRAKRALDEFVIDGIHTTLPFHKIVIEHQDFVEGNFDTGFIERKILN